MDWQQTEILEADSIRRDVEDRYLHIPQRDTHDAYNVMRDFVYTVENERLADRLQDAIRDRGAFRYFKDVLYEYPAEKERWLAYRDRRMREGMRDWLEENDIESTNDPRPRS